MALMVSQERLQPTDELAGFAPAKNVQITGSVDSPIDDRGNRVLFMLKVREVIIDGESIPVSGSCRTTLYYNSSSGETTPALQYGDQVTMLGDLHKPRPPSYPGAFDYRLWLLSRGARSLLTVGNPQNILSQEGGWGNPGLKLAYLFQEKGSSVLGELIPGAGGALMRGMVLGDRKAVPQEMEEGFRESGVVHILAISGQNLSVIALVLFYGLNLVGLSRRKNALIVAPLLVFYALATGFNPPVMRALVMALTVLGGLILFRQVRLANSLALAWIVLLIPNPAILYDVGFQLSFAAVAGIVYLYPYIKQVFRRLPRVIGGSLSLTISAQLAVIPLLAYHFFRVSLISFVSNIIVIPLSSMAMVLGFVTLLLSPTGMGAIPTSQASWLLSQATVELGVGFGRLPHASLWVAPPHWTIMGLYYLVLLSLPLLWQKRWRFITTTCIICSVGAVVWTNLLIKDQPKLRISFLDVGNSDSILIETPEGKNYLLDGSTKTKGEDQVAPYLRYLGINKLDGVIMSHPDNDHIGGLSYILENFSVGNFYDPGYPVIEDSYINLLQTLGHSQTNYQRIYPYLKLDCRETNIYFTAPIFLPPFPPPNKEKPEVNEMSGVMVVEYDGAEFLFTGDREAIPPLPKDWREYGGVVLKLPHHGSHINNVGKYLQTVAPLCAVITNNRNKQFPNRETEKALNDLGIKYWVTGDAGTVVMEVSEGRLTVSW